MVLVDDISGTFHYDGDFMIKYQLHGEDFNYLINLASDEDHKSTFEEQELNAHPKSFARIYLLVQPMLPRPATEDDI